MADLSATRKIISISTQDSYFFTGSGYGSSEKITVTEKAGDGAYVIWYQVWQGGQVVKEVNSRLVSVVEYEPITDEPVPF